GEGCGNDSIALQGGREAGPAIASGGRYSRGALKVQGTMFDGELVQGEAECLDFFQCCARAAKHGEAAQHAGQRPHEVEGGNDVTGEGLSAKSAERRDQK